MEYTFQGLIKIYLDHFNKHGEPSIPFLVNGAVSSDIFLREYQKLPPIEKMPEREKKEMKQYVIGLFPDKTPEEKIIACKIIYCIGTLI